MGKISTLYANLIHSPNHSDLLAVSAALCSPIAGISRLSAGLSLCSQLLCSIHKIKVFSYQIKATQKKQAIKLDCFQMLTCKILSIIAAVGFHS